MGSGSWDRSSFISYTTATKCGAIVDSLGSISTSLSNQDIFKQKKLNKQLNPYKVTRECLDTEEHPNTKPVILALDVSGSLGEAGVEIAKKLNVIMTDIYNKVEDVEFMIMGIGDFYCDSAPLQVSQFESDIRIAEQLDNVWFEFGGGGNAFESYTAAWYFGVNHCKLDCWKRGQKGIIITMGDEQLNPYIPKEGRYSSIEETIGDIVQDDILTEDLYTDTIEKYDVYHLHVEHGSYYDASKVESSWRQYLDDDHFKVVNLNNIANEIVNIITKSTDNDTTVSQTNNGEGISW